MEKNGKKSPNDQSFFDDLKQKLSELFSQVKKPLTKKQVIKALNLRGVRAKLALKSLLEEFHVEQLRFSPAKKPRKITKKIDYRGRLKVGYVDKSLSIIMPCHRKDDFRPVTLPENLRKDVSNGDVVVFGYEKRSTLKIVDTLGTIDNPKIYAKMAAASYGIPSSFSNESIEIAKKATVPSLEKREDLTHLSLVTIDGEDAKDFDDAVYGEPDLSPGNNGGWRLVVAIADVSYYVRPGTSLDHEAFLRGNSTYFVEHVIPMLPEALSNGLCSLQPDTNRACLAVEIFIDKEGQILSYRFIRGIMRSRARLTYTKVQSVIDGISLKDSPTALINNLYAAYRVLKKAREKRGTVNIQSDEINITLNEKGEIASILPKKQLESHQLIEELMIAANICAAKFLHPHTPTLYRIHDRPDDTRVENLRTVLKGFNLSLGKGKATPSPHHFNQLLDHAKNQKFESLVNDLVLRCQAQASYSPTNIGHYGLGLTHYAHFTSPIRRYADLIVHRSILHKLNIKEGADIVNNPDKLDTIAEHISFTERRSSKAEREVTERYIALYLTPRVGDVMKVQVVGVSAFGLYVKDPQTRGEGFLSRHDLKRDSYHFDEDFYKLIGKRTGAVYQLGDLLEARLIKSDPITSEIRFEAVTPMPISKQKKSRSKKNRKF